MGARLELGELLQLAAAGDRAAWSTLVERYEGLLWGIARSHRLDDSSASDVVQTTWMRLVENVDDLRNPEAIAGWLATTVRNECLRVLRHQSRQVPTEDDRMPVASVPPVDESRLLERERDIELWQAFASLSSRCQSLLRLLAVEPAPTYDEVGAALGMAVGSIGPTRGRCLDMLRRTLTTRRIRTTPPGSYG
jgi:RNA polymerase sigma factor (sigma-70 family)